VTNPLLDPLARLVIGHRGTPVRAPENTIEGFREALSLGADGVEFDVRLSADGVPVVMHDSTLDRTTTATGAVRARSAAELQTVVVKGHEGRPSAARVPTLEQALDALGSAPIVIEVKESAAVEPTERLVHRFGAHGRVVLGSSDADVSARLYHSALPACASMSDAIALIPRALLGLKGRAPRYNVLSITPRYHRLPIPVTRMAAAVRRHGVPTQVWTVNDPERAARYWRGGVAAILTDDTAAIVRARSH
jgi:glycerophosphoryl diester phosphodiesterase